MANLRLQPPDGFNLMIGQNGSAQEELLRMEAAGVIPKVDQPSPWCAGGHS